MLTASATLGFFESRTASTVVPRANSTQSLPAPLRLDLRHVIVMGQIVAIAWRTAL